MQQDKKFGYCSKCNAYQFLSYLRCNYNGICNGVILPEPIKKEINQKIKQNANQ